MNHKNKILLLKRLSTFSAIVYVLAWVIGLSTGIPNLSLHASGKAVAAAYGPHQTAAILQFVIAEGVTGLLLASMATACYLSRKMHKASAFVFLSSALAAGVLSIVMAILGVHLVQIAAASADLIKIENLNAVINGIDGPKMWLLAAMAIGGLYMEPSLPTWLRPISYALAISLIVSGIAYALLLQSLAWTVYISGVLLLVWVGAFGVITGRLQDAANIDATH